ncbi:hypothetical protein IKD60_01885 [Candidatus Saccharibacteria bacterium]|nr:hypothetical protein [Candidatus Saccharibacteria bacterium]
MSRFSKKIIAVIAFASMAISASLFSQNVFADSGTIIKKWTFMQLYNCIENGDINSTINTQKSGKVAKDVFSGGKSYYMLTGMTKHDTMNCRDIFMGKGSNKSGVSGALDYAGISSSINWTDYQAAASMLERVGYTASTPSGDSSYFIIDGKITSTIDSLNNQTISNKIVGSKIGDKWKYTASKSSVKVGSPSSECKVAVSFDMSGNYKKGTQKLTIKTKKSKVVIPLDATDPAATRTAIAEALNGQILNVTCNYASTAVTFGLDGAVTEDAFSQFTYNGRPDLTINSLGGFPNRTALLLTEDETYELYKGYFDQAITSGVVNPFSCTKQDAETYKDEIHLKDSSGQWRVYYYNSKAVNTDKNFLVQTSNFDAELQGLDFIIAWFNSHPATPFNEEESCPLPEEGMSHEDSKVVPSVKPGSDGSTSDGDPSERCFENAGVMGHTLCPILSAVSQFTDSIYYYIENNFLMINTNEMFGSGGSGGVRDAWGVVRDIANVCFVIVLLVIIFSQITGFGIDNYGIKRMLPRLIIMAIMVNISFFICQIMVDISNIAGVSIKNFMEGTIQLNSSASTIGNSGGAAGILGTVAAGGILVGLAFLNPGIILALITGIISAVIGLLFMFVILLARQIGVIILIILAPLAFICYMLPNTEKYFTKWRTAFLAILLAYPLCALAMGAGTMVGNIMANTGSADGNAVLLIGAMVVNVLPFFFIPMLLQNAMSALGNIGGKIAGIGQRIGRGVGGFASGAVQRGRAFNNLSNASKEFNAEYLRGGEKNRLQRRVDRLNANGGPKTDRQRRQLALAQSRLNTMAAEDATAEAGIGAKDYNALVADAKARRYQEDVNAIKAQTVSSNLVSTLGDEGKYDWQTAKSSDLYYDEDGKLKQTMAAQLYQYAVDGNQEGMAAITEQLSEKGHHGQEAVRQVMSQLQKDGKGDAMQSIAKTIMNNGKMAADYKSGARSSYDYMAKIAAGEGYDKDTHNFSYNINDLSKNRLKASNYSQESFAKMDNEELQRISKALETEYYTKNPEGKKEADAIRALAASTLDNGLLTGETKNKNIETMNQIAGRSFQVRQTAGGGSSAAPVPSSGDAAMDAFQQAQANINAERVAQQQRQNAQNSADATGEMYENIFNNQRNS